MIIQVIKLRSLSLNFYECAIGIQGARAVAENVPAALSSLSLNFEECFDERRMEPDDEDIETKIQEIKDVLPLRFRASVSL